MKDSGIYGGLTTESTANGARAFGAVGMVTSNIEIRDHKAARCAAYSFSGDNFDNLRIVDFASENPGFGAVSNFNHMNLASCIGTKIEDPKFIVNDSTVNINTCVRETGTSNYTIVTNPTIDDNQTEVTTDFTFIGANSYAYGLVPLGINSLAYTGIVAKYAMAPVAVVTFTNTDATPTVLGGRLFITTGTTTITDFDDGVLGQTIKIRCTTSSLTITNNASIIKLAGATNYVMTADDTLTLTMYVDQVWTEDCRSVN
jgi:hypothetical protein